MSIGEEQHRQSARPWKRDGDDHVCAKHGTRFRLPITCPRCDADPAQVSTAEPKFELPDPPTGCLSSTQLERWFVGLARDAKRDADRLVAEAVKEKAKPAKKGKPKNVNFHAEANVVKHRELALKAARAAAELARSREDQDIVFQREARLRALGGGAEH